MTKKKIIQKHHISYDPEIAVYMSRGEHWLMTQLNRYKHISTGFVIALRVWLALNEHNAKEIKK